MKEYIVRFHVAVHDVVFIEDLEGLEELFEDEQSIGFWEFDLLGEEILEGTTVAVLIDKVEIVGCFEHVVVLDDIGVAFYVGEDVDLVDCALLQLLILFKFIDGDHLYRVFFFVVVVYGSIYFTIHARSDRFV